MASASGSQSSGGAEPTYIRRRRRGSGPPTHAAADVAAAAVAAAAPDLSVSRGGAWVKRMLHVVSIRRVVAALHKQLFRIGLDTFASRVPMPPRLRAYRGDTGQGGGVMPPPSDAH